MNRISRRGFRHLLLFLAAPMLVLLAAVLMSRMAAIPFHLFVRDPASIAGHHPLMGVLSNLGNLLWCTCAAVCAFGSQLLAREQGVTEGVRHLRGAALLTLILLLDDFFMVHDYLSDFYFGIKEPVIVALICAAAVCYLWRFREAIFASEWGWLLFALACLVGSVLIDLVKDLGLAEAGPWLTHAEEPLKFLGIAAWCGYHYRLTTSLLLQPVPQASRAQVISDHRQQRELTTPRSAA